MEDTYLKQLYNQLNTIDPTYGKDVPFDKFQSSVKDKDYATTLYNQIVSIDPTYKEDVSFDKFYSSISQKEEKGFFSKVWENIKSGDGIFGKPDGTPVKREYKSHPSLLEEWLNSFSPSWKEKEQTKKQLQELPTQQSSPKLDPISQAKKDYEDVVNPFKEFRKYVPDPLQLSDSLNVGNDLFSFGYQPKHVKIQDDEAGIKDQYIVLGDSKLDKGSLKERVAEFKQQKDEQIKRLLAEKHSKIAQIYQKYPDEGGIVAAVNQSAEIKLIDEEYNQKINNIEKSYNKLYEDVFQPELTKIQNSEQFKYRKIDATDIDKQFEQLQNSLTYLINLNKQEKAYRLRDAAIDALESQYLGEDPEKFDKEVLKYDNPELSNNFVSRNPLSRESKEYQGIIKQLAINRSFLDGYKDQRDQLLKILNERKAYFEQQLQDLYSKGLTINDLTPESRKSIEKYQNKFKKLESLIDLYEENIKESEKRNEVLLSDIADFKELINYKAEQDKINRLYIEKPVSTFIYSFPSEFAKKLGDIKELPSLLNIISQKKLGNISQEEADFYKSILSEESQRKVYVQKLVKDEDTGEMVYRNLKDLESVSIFDKEGRYKPVGEWIQNADALVYQIFNTTAESLIIGGTGLIARKGLYSLGKSFGRSILSEMSILEAIEGSTVGLSGLDKARLLGMQGLKKGAMWTSNVSSMLPATTFLYSPEIINTEIEKGLSVEDIIITANLRILAETIAENTFFDDVKFVDNILKRGEIKNFQDLAKSEAYRTLMDKVSLATVGRRLSELEYKTLFTGEGIRKLLSKENLKFLVKRTLPNAGRYAIEATAYSLETSGKESGEEILTNTFNYLIDEWRRSEDRSYESDQELTLENQANTVIQTMASMLLLGVTEGRRAARAKESERRFNIDLAAYQVAISPDIFKENLYNQYLQSQKTENPMSNDELALRMEEIDRLSSIYKSLGFSEEKTKENIKLQLEKLKGDKKQIDDVLKNELEKQAEREVRNTEFQAFREALTTSDLQNRFLAAKTDKEKDEVVKRIDDTFEKINTLKEQRTIQQDALIKQRKLLEAQEYSDLRLKLSNVVENLDSFIESIESLNDLEEILSNFSQFEDTTDKAIKDYASIITTALKNRQYELLSQREKRESPEELAERQKFEANNFSEKEKQLIEHLGIEPEEISKVDGKIIYNYEGKPVEFNNFKEITDFKQKKHAEKQEQILKAQKEREDFEELNNIQRAIGDAGKVFKTSKNKFGIEFPSGETVEFDSIEDLRDYILSSEDKEENDLNLFNQEVDILYQEYTQSRKKPLSKSRWIKTKRVQKKIQELKEKYKIKDDYNVVVVEEDSLATTFVPLAVELTDDEVVEVNNVANIETLSSNTIVQEGNKLVNAFNIISYQARQFEEKVEVDENQAVNRIEDSVNELNKEFLFLHSPEFKIGQEFTIVVKPFENSPFVEQERETLRNNARYLIEQDVSQDEINQDLADDEMFQEIQIFTANGTKRVGAIHSLSYIRPSRVVPYLIDENGKQTPNLEYNYRQLKALRKSLISAVKQGKTVSLIFTNKSAGWLSYRVNFENKVVKEAFKNKEVLENIQVISRQSKLRIKGQETVNEVLQGTTAIPIIMPNGSYFAFTLSRKNLVEKQADSFINAILLHAKYHELYQKPATEEIRETLKNIQNLAASIERDTDFDILTPDGLKNYLQLFVNVNSKTSDYYSSAERETLKNQPFIDVDKDDKTGNFRITFSNSRTFEAFNPEVSTSENFKNIGIYRIKLSDIINNTEDIGTLLKILKVHLLKRKINHSAELSKGLKATIRFNLPYIKKSNLATNPFLLVSETELNQDGLSSSYRNYKEFLLETSTTPLLETELPDGTYTYFQQPNLAFVPKITEEEEEEPVLYKGIKVVEDRGIKTKSGEPGAAKFDRKNNVIRINSDALRNKFESKAWMQPRKLSDKSSATPLPEDIFQTFEQWKDFVIEHEYQHSLLSRNDFKKMEGNADTTEGEYEDYINNKALEEIGLKKAEDELKEQIGEEGESPSLESEKKEENVLPLSEEVAQQEILEQQFVSDDTSLEAADKFLEENLFLLEKTMEFKDGNTYRYSEINSEMLEEMGYTPEEIGGILKQICE